MPHAVTSPVAAAPIDRLSLAVVDARLAGPSAPQIAEFCFAGE